MTIHRRGRRAQGHAAVAAWALASSIGLAGMFGPGLAHACEPASYCDAPGACLSIAQVQQQASAAYGPRGFTVSSVRLKGQAPTSTCLWFEVVLSGEGGRRVVYWNVNGGEAR